MGGGGAPTELCERGMGPRVRGDDGWGWGWWVGMVAGIEMDMAGRCGADGDGAGRCGRAHGEVDWGMGPRLRGDDGWGWGWWVGMVAGMGLVGWGWWRGSVSWMSGGRMDPRG